MPKMFNDPALEDYATNFLGYGRLDAPAWFIGMEEGGGNSFEEVARRIEAWADLGRNSVEDIYCYHLAIGIQEWFAGPRPKLQSTWGALARIQLGLQGGNPKEFSQGTLRELVRDYQKNRLGRSDGNERLMELLPLPSPSTQHWLYALHSKLYWLADRNAYVQFQAPQRSRRIQEEIDRYKPKFVIFFGLTFKEHWIRIARASFLATATRDLSIVRRGATLFAIVPHPVSHGLSWDFFLNVGHTLYSTQARL
jgi:hypothetical protein